MLDLNPFVLCSTTGQAIYRQCADRERWIVDCFAIGADRQALEDYDRAALAYAASWPIYPAADVIAYCRHLARAALQRGEPLPMSPQQAIEAENRRSLAHLLGGR